jgi:hypothetical protein
VLEEGQKLIISQVKRGSSEDPISILRTDERRRKRR